MPIVTLKITAQWNAFQIKFTVYGAFSTKTYILIKQQVFILSSIIIQLSKLAAYTWTRQKTQRILPCSTIKSQPLPSVEVNPHHDGGKNRTRRKRATEELNWGPRERSQRSARHPAAASDPATLPPPPIRASASILSPGSSSSLFSCNTKKVKKKTHKLVSLHSHEYHWHSPGWLYLQCHHSTWCVQLKAI
jgi:hypothetical protein